MADTVCGLCATEAGSDNIAFVLEQLDAVIDFVVEHDAKDRGQIVSRSRVFVDDEPPSLKTFTSAASRRLFHSRLELWG
jgi:hypothetical protein